MYFKQNRLTFKYVEDNRVVDWENKIKINKGNFNFQSYFKTNVTNMYVCKALKLQSSYRYKDVHFSVEGAQKNTNWLNALTNLKMRVGLAYSGKNKHQFGVMVDIDTEDCCQSKKTCFFSGVLDGKHLYKAKVDDSMNLELFTKFKVNSNWQVLTSMRGNMKNFSGDQGFLGSPCNFGLKFKFES